jgi:hypothetical protein
MTIVTNDTGRTFLADALNEPGFGGFVAGLTDGINGYIRFCPGFTIPEQGFLGRASLAPDLAGSSITQINFRVNNFHDWYFAPEETYY